MALTTANDDSSSTSPCTTYEVFLSFRGQDTRKNFTDHLYTALKGAGIHVFRDDDGINRGRNIDEEIENAIRESKISVIVFSKGFASSTYCLQEVVMILECMRVGHISLPVFYDVDPLHVRDQSGSFAEAFAAHEKCFEEHKVGCWRETLRKVADLAGMVLGERLEAQFIQEIVKDIRNKLNKKILYVPSYLVGIDSCVKEINSWLQNRLHEARTGIIHGIGGIGKTTIAKIVYNDNCNRFDATCFLANVRKTAEQHGLVLLQRQIFKKILEMECDINNEDEGVMKIKDATCCRKVLIVLDDVDSVDQFEMIVGMRDWFYPGSKIIVTTRLEGLLNTVEVCKKFEVQALNSNESLQLFRWHAFRNSRPSKQYMEDSKTVVNYCCGIPLALEVLGRSLSGLSSDLWKRALKEPKTIDSEGKIQKILRISYDSLRHSQDKSLFLDMACFFIEREKEDVYAVIEGCNLYRPLGIQNLIDRCLKTIDKDKRFMMHQLLVDMARGVVREESKDPGKRSRLWCHEDSIYALRKNTGEEAVTSLVLDLKQENMSLKTVAFKKMKNLKLLDLNAVRLDGSFENLPNPVMLNGSFENFPKGLVWLRWHQFPLRFIPNRFCLYDLIVLDMQYSNLTHVWRGTRFLPALKILDLSRCYYLTSSPDFSGIRNLEKVVLEDCINLVKVHDSVGCLERLLFLSLRGCTSLEQLPKEIGMLKSLKELVLSKCLNLVKHRTRALQCWDGIGGNGLQYAIRTRQHFSWSPSLQSRRCLRYTSFCSVVLPVSLTKLNLSFCNISDDATLRDLFRLPSLTELNLSGNPIQSVPESVKSLTKLNALILRYCRRLRSLPVLPSSLIVLGIEDCVSLQAGFSFVYRYRGIMSSDINKWKCWGYDNECAIFFDSMVEDETNDITKIKCKTCDIIKFKLYLFECMESIQLSGTMSPSQEAIIKIIEDCGIFNFYFDEESVIPNWFSHQEVGNFINFVVPHDYNTCVLNLCIIVTDINEEGSYSFSEDRCIDVDVEMYNVTKNISWIAVIHCFLSEYSNQEMLLLSMWRWKWMNGLESGNRIRVKVIPNSSRYYIKECGVHLILVKQEERTTHSRDGDGIQSTSLQCQTMMDQEVSTYREGEPENDQLNNMKTKCWIRVPLHDGTQVLERQERDSDLVQADITGCNNGFFERQKTGCQCNFYQKIEGPDQKVEQNEDLGYSLRPTLDIKESSRMLHQKLSGLE